MTKKGHSEIWLDNPGARLRLLTLRLPWLSTALTGAATELDHSFIHSDHFYSASSSPLLLRSAPTQHGYCAGVSRRSAPSNCELRTCPRSLYVTAKAGVEPTTLRLKAIDSANAPRRPTKSRSSQNVQCSGIGTTATK